MITVANRIYINPSFAETFETRFKERAGLVDGLPGFLFNQVLRPSKAGDPYIVFTCWESQEDFQNWLKSDAFKEGHAKSGRLPKAAFDKKNQIEIHQIIMDSRDPELIADHPITMALGH